VTRPATWPLVTALMMGEMFGVGALALPSALARLGCVLCTNNFITPAHDYLGDWERMGR
jgi:hypothetical protein